MFVINVSPVVARPGSRETRATKCNNIDGNGVCQITGINIFVCNSHICMVILRPIACQIIKVSIYSPSS